MRWLYELFRFALLIAGISLLIRFIDVNHLKYGYLLYFGILLITLEVSMPKYSKRDKDKDQ